MNDQGPNKDVNKAGPPGGPAWDETEEPVQWQPDDGAASSGAAGGAGVGAPESEDVAAGSGAGGAGGGSPGNQDIGGMEDAEARQRAEMKELEEAHQAQHLAEANEMMRRTEEMSRELPRFRKGK